jgi:hypothetical protein
MIHNISFKANWDQIQKRKQDIINESNQKENKISCRIPYEYKVGDQVFLETPGILRKLSTPRTGPYPVMCTSMVQSEFKKTKMDCIRKSDYPWNHSIQSKSQLSIKIYYSLFITNG